jgi:hypothetical protein
MVNFLDHKVLSVEVLVKTASPNGSEASLSLTPRFSGVISGVGAKATVSTVSRARDKPL